MGCDRSSTFPAGQPEDSLISALIVFTIIFYPGSGRVALDQAVWRRGRAEGDIDED